MRALHIHPAASRELDQALGWCQERFGRKVSDRLLLQFDRAATLLRTQPEIGSPAAEAGFRKLALPRFPYSLIYRIEGNRIVVLALHHQRRRPGYWVGRR